MGPDGTTQTEERLFISSLEPDPEQLLEAVRHHSRVENKLHWTLDVAFEEDLSRVRTGHAAQNLGIVRRLALSLLKQETSRSVGVKLKRKDAGWNSDYLLGLPSEGAHRRKLNAIARYMTIVGRVFKIERV